jgi:Flp pilus assembly pilin Flp
MSLPVSLPTPLLRDRLAALAAMPLVIAAGLTVHTDAVANRFVNKVGVSGINFRLSSLVDTVLKPASGAGKVEINNLIVALVALVLLGAIVFFLFGVLKTMGGRRGGIETLGQVVFALVVGIAGLEVLA